MMFTLAGRLSRSALQHVAARIWRVPLRSLRQRPEHLGDAPSIRRVREDQPACWRVVFIDLEDLKQNPLAVESRDRFVTGAFERWVHGGFKVFQWIGHRCVLLDTTLNLSGS